MAAHTEELERRVRIDPGDADALLELGDAYRSEGRPQRAINVYLQSAERYGERDAWQRVAAIYKMILMLDPSALAVRSKLADVLCLIGLKKEAQDELLRLAKVYQTAGDLDMRDKTLKRLEVLFAGDRAPPHCAFCGRAEREVRKLVAREEISGTGSEVFICDACAKKCAVILERQGLW